MGVRNLEGYICKIVENGFFKVDIKEEVEKWKRANQKSSQKSDEQPIIVIDLLGMNRMLPAVLNEYEGLTLCGGRHQFVVELCSQFFIKLIDLGVKLVFFDDGQREKYPTWYDNKDRKYENMIKILDDVYNNLITSDLVTKYKEIIPNSVNIPALKVACKKYGEFHKSFNVVSDLAIAKYATEKNALAVIADDSDFLIFEGVWKYWSSRNLNLSSLTTMEYNKIALREALGLDVRQMPLLATVGGTNIVVLGSGNRFLDAQYGKKKFPEIAKYVRFTRNYPGHMNNDIFRQISKKCFGDDDQQLTDLIIQSLESYNIRSQPAEPLQDELLSKTFNDHGIIYNVLIDRPINYTILFYDFRRSDFKNYYELIERLILRPMGVLLKHKNDPKLKRTIVTKKSQDQGYGEFLVTPEYPKIEVPSLIELLFDAKDEKLIPIRFELLAWIMSDKIQAKILQEIPTIYLADILVLIYLLEHEQISLIEADSVLRTIYNVQNNLVPVDISSPLVIDERAMRFCFLYMKVFLIINNSLSAVGIKNMETQFDAVYYHMKYREYKTIPVGERENLMEDLKDLRWFCLAAL